MNAKDQFYLLSVRSVGEELRYRVFGGGRNQYEALIGELKRGRERRESAEKESKLSL